MVKLVRACNQVKPPFNWEAIGEVICRHLGLALSSPRDLKRIFKERRVAEVISRLVECAKSNEAHLNVLGGFLSIVRRLTLDAVFGRELAGQDVYSLIVRHNELHAQSHEFRNVVIDTLSILLKYSPVLADSHNHAIAGTARVGRLIPESINDSSTFSKILALTLDHLAKLNTYKLITKKPLPPEVRDTLELPRIASMMVNLLEERNPAVLLWESLDTIAIILTWIAYYQSDAILRMPDNKGVLLFVAFMQCSSVAIRCRGFMGLLNLHYPDFAQELRFCNPQEVNREEAPEVGRIYRDIEMAMAVRSPTPSDEVVSEKFHNPSLRELFGSNPYHAYEIAMRFVKYQTEGPQSDKDLFPYLQRYLAVDKLANDLFTDLEFALRFHNQEYEAEVLRLARFLHMYPGLPREPEDYISDLHRFISMTIAAESTFGIHKWPDKAYFYYAKVKSQTGTEYALLVAEAANLPDCSPYLKGKLWYELAVNLLACGIINLSMRSGLNRWEGPVCDSESANLFFAPAQEQLMLATTRAGRESAEGQVLAILLYVTVLLSQGPELGSAMLELPIPKVRKNLETLTSMQSSHHQEMRNAVVDYLQHRKRAAIRWSAIILAVRRVEPSATEGRKLRARQASDSGLLLDKSREDDFLTLNENPKATQILRCTWCGRSSVALKKCSRCEKVGYCNKTCQRSHWNEGHKKVCISPVIAI